MPLGLQAAMAMGSTHNNALWPSFSLVARRVAAAPFPGEACLQNVGGILMQLGLLPWAALQHPTVQLIGLEVYEEAEFWAHFYVASPPRSVCIATFV
jgi:hypothetical protein